MTSSREMINPAKTNLSVNNRALTAPEKAAVIISLLGAESAGPIVDKIEDCHLRSFMSALENINQLPRESMLAVVAEFITELHGRRGSFKGGPNAAKELVSSMFPEDRVTQLFGAPPPPPPPKTSADKVWALLSEHPVEEVAKYLSSQKSAVAAIALSKLDIAKAGEILSELPEEVSLLCVAEMSRGSAVDPRTVDAIAELIETELFIETPGESGSESAVFVGEVLGILPRDRRNKMLDALEASDPVQAALVRKSMFTFEDLKEKLPVTAIPIIFRDFDQVDLIRVLKVGGEQQPDIIEFLYENISQRMANDFKDQVGDLNALNPKQGDAAISSLMTFINKLEKEGRIVLIKKEPQEAA